MDTTHKIILGDVFDKLKELPDKSVHMICSSPPFYLKRKYSDKQSGLSSLEFGREESPDCYGWATGNLCNSCYVCKTILLFRELKRVLRDDGLIYWEIGDSFFSEAKPKNELKPGDLTAIPFRVFLALQKDGWIARQACIWAKGISGFGTKYGWAGSCLPESAKNRFANSHEYVFMFAKQKEYFFDYAAVQEDSTLSSKKKTPVAENIIQEKRNHRSVWTTEKNMSSVEHCAVFPHGLVEIMIKSGSSEKGCCSKCGAPIKRKVEVIGKELTQAMKEAGCNSTGFYTGDPTKDYYQAQAQNPADSKRSILKSMSKIKKSSWVAGCSCGGDAIPCTILDPFAGSGVSLAVAKRLGRSSIGIDLNPAFESIMQKALDNSDNPEELKNPEISGHVENQIKQHLILDDSTLSSEIVQLVDEKFWDLL